MDTEFSSECWILGGEVVGPGVGHIKVEARPSGDELICSTNIYCVVILCQAFD